MGGLPWFGLLYFLICATFPVVRKKKVPVFGFLLMTGHQFFMLLGVAAVGFNVYLACILKFVLKEFCIVCGATYVLNGGCFTCFLLEYLATEKALKRRVKQQ